jgi:hypothetical protein
VAASARELFYDVCNKSGRKLPFPKHDHLNSYKGWSLEVYASLTSILDESESSASRFRHVIPEERPSVLCGLVSGWTPGQI